MRKRSEEREMLDALKRWMKKYPHAGVSVAVAWFQDDYDRSCLSQCSVNCSPVHLVAVADYLLERAATRISQMPQPDVDNIKRINRARLELDFSFHADAKGTA